MKVKEMIIRLLEEDMNAEVFVATTDESRKDKTSTEKNNVTFDITEVEHWGHSAYIGFTDWRRDMDDPQQKIGKWILADEQNKEDVENDNYRFICSECQCSDIHAKDTIVPYCWKCGAWMIEPQERSDKE